MKRTILIAVCLSMRMFAQTQPVTLEVGERLPNLYYWDTNWVDYVQLTYGGNTPLFHYGVFEMYDCFYGRPCITKVPMKVIGVAGLAVKRNISGPYYPPLDSVRLPEYFYLYQVESIKSGAGVDSLYLLDSANWDTATVHYKVKMPFQYFPSTSGWDNYTDTVYNLYEVYFETPHWVHDTFVVGGTTHNNLVRGYDAELFPNHPYEGYEHYDNVQTYYAMSGGPLFDGVPYYPNPPYHYKKYYRPYYHSSNVNGSNPMNTTSMEVVDFGVKWLPFFAIFDTSFVYEACMGVATTGLQVEAVDTSGTATLAWDDSGVEQWQVSVAPQGVEADSGTLYATPVNYLQVSGLTTGQWYEVWVRTLCDTDLFGAWYGPTLFYVPGASCVTPTGLHVTAVDSAMVSLAWDAGMASTWQVERGLCDLGMSNAQTVTTTAPSLTVADLPYGDAWYWARVRVVCDSDFWSDWTDTVRFYVPNQHTGSGPDDTTQAINLVEQYTYLMPNPARDEVTVASSFRVKAVELYAADGKLLQQVEVNAVGTTLSLEGLPAGIYFVRVRTSAGVTTKRLVVE